MFSAGVINGLIVITPTRLLSFSGLRNTYTSLMSAVLLAVVSRRGQPLVPSLPKPAPQTPRLPRLPGQKVPFARFPSFLSVCYLLVKPAAGGRLCIPYGPLRFAASKLCAGHSRQGARSLQSVRL